MKILGSDYDGTLYQNGITEAKISAIEKWRAAGHKFGIVSGRGKDFRVDLLHHYSQLKLDFFIAFHGGYIMDENGTVIYEARCNEISLSELATDLFAWGCKFLHVNGERYVCLVERAEDRPAHVSEEEICLLEQNSSVDYFYQISLELPSVEDSSKVTEEIKKKYAKWLNPLQNGRCIGVVPAGVDKAQGMYRVMEFFGCTYGDVITVGDDINDMDMIREFHSYAMENGVEKVRKLADGIVSDVTEILEKEL